MTQESKVSLYGLTTDLAILENLFSSDELIESSDELQAEAANRIEEVTVLLQAKVDSVCGYNQSLEDYIEAIEARISELKELKDNVEKKQRRFHNYILTALDRLGTSKIAGELYTVSYRKPSKKVQIIDENKIPAKYAKIKETVVIDKKQIGDDLKLGEIVEGATLVDSERNLSFKAGK